jgi:hypothetical protein
MPKSSVAQAEPSAAPHCEDRPTVARSAASPLHAPQYLFGAMLVEVEIKELARDLLLVAGFFALCGAVGWQVFALSSH